MRLAVVVDLTPPCTQHPTHNNTALLGIRAMWVSHPHADHHLGLMRVLVARQEAARRLAHSAPPVLVLAPRPVLAWLEEFRRVDPEATWTAGTGAAGKEDGGGAKEDPYLVDVERCVVVCMLYAVRVHAYALDDCATTADCLPACLTA